MQYNLCGCGREIRYMTPNGDACNKYSRCPTYDELRNSLGSTNSKLLNLLAIIHRDGAHYTFEAGLEQSVDKAEQILRKWKGAYDALGNQLILYRRIMNLLMYGLQEDLEFQIVGKEPQLTGRNKA